MAPRAKSRRRAPAKKTSPKPASKPNTPKYDNTKHLKFADDYRSKTRQTKTDKMREALENSEKETQQGINTSVSMQEIEAQTREKYAHDLVTFSLLFEMLKNMTEKSAKEVEDSKNYLNRSLELDKAFEQNMKSYSEFKTTVKHLKIIEAKQTHSNLSTDEAKKLENQKNQIQTKLESVLKSFDFKMKNGTELNFSNKDDFIDFIKFTETSKFADSYRADITDAAALEKIAATPISKLNELAMQTVSDETELNAQSSEIQLNQNESTLKTAMNLATSVSPMSHLKP